jgi:hypothetical protein
MSSAETQDIYATISHRVAAEYTKFLASCTPAKAQGEEDARARLALHDFFSTFYAKLYQQPDLFGLPLKPDDSIAEDEPHEKEKKQEVAAKMKSPKELIARGLDFLARAGQEGQLVGQDLALDSGAELVKQTKVGKKFLLGLETAGLAILPEGDRLVLRNSQFPAMMTALQALAKACAQYTSPRAGRFHFARADFRALQPDYCPQALDLYRDFAGDDLPRLTQLHEFFGGLGYQPTTEISEPFAWNVDYQGNRKIKATPLLQVLYAERYRQPLRVYVKCASTGRIAPLLPHQSQALQEDFQRRAISCGGDACGWCRNNKTLGPTLITYQGQERKLCWFSMGEVRHFGDQSIALIEDYARLHEELLPV